MKSEIDKIKSNDPVFGRLSYGLDMKTSKQVAAFKRKILKNKLIDFALGLAGAIAFALVLSVPSISQAQESWYSGALGSDQPKPQQALPKGAVVQERSYYRENQGSFFDEPGDGYFWYEDPTKEQQVILPEQKPKVSAGKGSQKEQKSAGIGSGSGSGSGSGESATPLSTEWLRVNLQGYLDKAIDDPSPENVSAYLYLQRLAMDRSTNFTKTFEQVSSTDPYLNENMIRPQNALAKGAADSESLKAANEAIQYLAATSSLVFFIRSDCKYCHAQAPIMKLMEKKLNFNVMAVSTDMRGIDGYQNPEPNRGQAEMLGVTITPTIFLFSQTAKDKKISSLGPDGQMLPAGFIFITQGATPYEELKSLVITRSGDAGLIDRKVIRRYQGFDDRFLTPEALQKVDKKELDVLVKDPKKLAAFLRERLAQTE